MVVRDFSRWILVRLNIKKQQEFDEADEEELRGKSSPFGVLGFFFLFFVVFFVGMLESLLVYSNVRQFLWDARYARHFLRDASSSVLHDPIFCC